MKNFLYKITKNWRKQQFDFNNKKKGYLYYIFLLKYYNIEVYNIQYRSI